MTCSMIKQDDFQPQQSNPDPVVRRLPIRQIPWNPMCVLQASIGPSEPLSMSNQYFEKLKTSLPQLATTRNNSQLHRRHTGNPRE